MKKLISLLLLLSVPPVFASVGIVLFTMKKVVAENGGVTRTLTRGSPVDVNDVIITAVDAAAKIKYSNGTLVTIGANSRYKIVAYAPTQNEVLKAELKQGKIESKTNGGAKKEALKTPVVAMSITGTEYKVYVASTSKTNVALIAGKVTVGTKSIQAGDSVVATEKGVVFAPFPEAGNIKVPEAMSSITSTTTETSASNNATTTAQTSSAGTTTYVNSTVVATQNITSTSSSVTAAEQATFSIQCFPNGVPIN